MILQIDSFMPDSILWIFALGVAFGLALVLTLLIEGDELAFMTFLMISIGFMTWGGLIDGWIFIVVLTVFSVLIALEFKKGELYGS
ncbi:hypothetical protein LCGC14_1621900 [marine sediment metagenome]|uniref:Uncharacterized protein n=1 Tax=marine sediment metagenome TaxID=412755 RepID=A0A0F9I5G4_9ZZZZ